MKFGTIFGAVLVAGYFYVFYTAVSAVYEIYGESSWKTVAVIFVMGPVLFASFFSHPIIKEFIGIFNGEDRKT